MEYGKVKWFNAEKGYGFIERTDAVGDVFAHWRGINGDGYRLLEAGQSVAFDLESSDRGPVATNITVVHEG